jgi:hypothetical protein
MSWCGCEDYPCCGHDADRGPEDAQAWLEEMVREDPEGYEFALQTMRPCESCGEMRPRNDETMRRHGVCHMCRQDPVRSQSPVAQNNLAYARRDDRRRIRDLERLLKQNGIPIPEDDEEP